jgi:hypothetical protein
MTACWRGVWGAEAPAGAPQLLVGPALPVDQLRLFVAAEGRSSELDRTERASEASDASEVET